MEGKIALEEHFALEETLKDDLYKVWFPAWDDMRRRLLDLHDLRLTEMDKHGIEYSVLSLHNPAVQGVPDAKKAIQLARKANDLLAETVARSPNRFGGFAALPMQDPDAAIVELTRCVKELGFKGANVNGFSEVGSPGAVVYLDDARYETFWAAVEKLDVPFYLHPRDPVSREAIYEGHPWFRGSAWAFGAETSLHALRLMGSGLFDRYPGLNVILGHLGEGLPYMIWRVDHRIARTPRGIPARKRWRTICARTSITRRAAISERSRSSTPCWRSDPIGSSSPSTIRSRTSSKRRPGSTMHPSPKQTASRSVGRPRGGYSNSDSWKDQADGRGRCGAWHPATARWTSSDRRRRARRNTPTRGRGRAVKTVSRARVLSRHPTSLAASRLPSPAAALPH